MSEAESDGKNARDPEDSDAARIARLDAMIRTTPAAEQAAWQDLENIRNKREFASRQQLNAAAATWKARFVEAYGIR